MGFSKPGTSRREFIGRIGAGAATLAFQPLFSPGRSFALGTAAAEDAVHVNFNESPYGPSESAMKAMQNLPVSMYGRYFDDDSYEEMSTVLAKHHNLKRENIHVGVGSTEILKICDDVFLGGKASLVVAEPAYEAVLQYAANSKAAATKVALTKDYRHDLAKMGAAITPDTGMVYICNPNNPTGTIVTRDEMQRFMDRIPSTVTVVVDEAYSHFAGDSAFESSVRYVAEGRNLIVARTFSKIYGLAGMRIGYAIGKKDLIDKIKPFTVDYSITGLAVNAVIASIADTQHVARIAMLNAEQRQIFMDEMKKMKFEYTPSQANFIMVNVRTPVAPIIKEFEKRKVLVGREFPAMPNFLRVTFGTDGEMKKFYAAFRDVFRA